MTYDVKKGVVLQPTSQERVGTQRKYPFDTMQVGSVIFVPDQTTEKFSSYVHKVGRRRKMKFRTQTATMRQDLKTDEWEPCKPGAPGSRRGVAVTRTE